MNDVPEAVTGAEVLAEMLDGYGVTHFFMVPAVLRRTMYELERRTGIVRVSTHGEAPAAYMADGYARASGRVGVCGAQVIGAMNLAAGLREPWLAHSPVLALTGGRDPATTFRKVYQEVDDVPAFAQITKLNATVDDVGRFPDLLRQAFRVATSGVPGPVHLQFRGNEAQIDTERAPMTPAVEPRFARVPPVRPVPETADVTAALRAVESAARPVFVAGGGVRMSGAGADLLALAEALCVPVVTSLNGRDGLPGDHPLVVGVVGTYARDSANTVVSRADLVCFIGSETGGMTTHVWSLPGAGTRVVQIDIEPENLGRNYLLAAGVVGDARTTLRMMVARADRSTAAARREWAEEVGRVRAEWAARSRPLMTSEEVPTRPERICAELTTLVPDDAIVLVDTGHAGMWMAAYYDVRTPRQRYLRSCGHLGWAFPAGIGAKCGAPERPVVVFTGDAGAWYHIAELETAVRYGVNTVTVVNNNGGGNQSRRGFDRAYGGRATAEAARMWTFRPVDFAGLADHLGAVGLPVRSPREFAPALRKALALDRPVVIDVTTDIDVLPPLPPPVPAAAPPPSGARRG